MQLPFRCAVAMGGGELRIFLLYHLDLDSSQYFIINITFRRDFPEGTVFKTLCFQCRGYRLLCSTAKKTKIFSRECVLPYTSFSEVFFLSLDFYISTQILDWIHQVLKKSWDLCGIAFFLSLSSGGTVFFFQLTVRYYMKKARNNFRSKYYYLPFVMI